MDVSRKQPSVVEEEDEIDVSEELNAIFQEYDTEELKTERKKCIDKIDELKEQLLSSSLPNYLIDIEKEAEDEILIVGRIDEKDIRKEDQNLEVFREEAFEQDSLLAAARAQEIFLREKEIRQRIHQEQIQSELAIKEKEKFFLERIFFHRQNLLETFHRAENYLLAILKNRQAIVQATFGHWKQDKEANDFRTKQKVPKAFLSQVEKSHQRKFRLDWKHTPQPMIARIEQCRMVKHKLPKGKYVISIAMYDQLGGCRMSWSHYHTHKQVSHTVSNVINFSNDSALKFQESLLLYLPSESHRQLKNVIVFELFLLRSKSVYSDTIVASGAFPLHDQEGKLIEGKFKCPLFRGGFNSFVDKFLTLEEMIVKDLNCWIGNLYFEMTALPKYRDGDIQYEVDILYNNLMLNLGKKGQKEIADKNLETDAQSTLSIQKQLEQNMKFVIQKRKETSFSNTSPSKNESGELALIDDAKSELVLQAESNFININAWMTGRKQDKVYSTLTTEQQFNQYHYSLQKDTAIHGPIEESIKYRILREEVSGYFKKCRWNDITLYAFFFSLILSFLCCLILHEVGSYLVISAATIPTSSFSILFNPFSIRLDYLLSLSSIGIEVGRVWVSWVCLLFPPLILSLLCLLLRHIGSTPLYVFYHFLLSYLLLLPFFPFLLIPYDAVTKGINYTDLLQLYHIMEKKESSGILGVAAFLLSTVLFFGFSALFLYGYLLYIHKNGVIEDLVRRLNGNENTFLLPFDNEVSFEELNAICYDCRQFVGDRGEGYIVDVQEIVVINSNGREERSSLIIIFFERGTGSRELFRQFMRLADGTILEFGKDSNLKREYYRMQGNFGLESDSEGEEIDDNDDESEELEESVNKSGSGQNETTEDFKGKRGKVGRILFADEDDSVYSRTATEFHEPSEEGSNPPLRPSNEKNLRKLVQNHIQVGFGKR